jgi:hypothetical protein
VEIIDTEDGYGRIRRIPVKAIVTGKLATAIGAQFPEIGLKRHPQVAHGGGYRFKVIFTRENDERVEVFVVATLGEKWIWCEGHSYWELTPGVAYELVGQCRDAKEDPSTTMPSTTQP